MSLRAGYKGLKPEQIRKIEEVSAYMDTNTSRLDATIAFMTDENITALTALIDGAPYEPASGSMTTKKATTKKKTGGD